LAQIVTVPRGWRS